MSTPGLVNKKFEYSQREAADIKRRLLRQEFGSVLKGLTDTS